MAGAFTWLDYSEHDRRRALDFVDQFRERATRDELGIGTVRDALSDVLFPGISTIQTRARYFLFVPWLYRELEQSETAAADVARLARRSELDLIDVLADGDDLEGVIGIEARRTLKRLPSNIYWQGLYEWGIRRHPAPQASYHRFFKAFSLAAKVSDREGDDEQLRGTSLRPMWSASIPPPPKDFPANADFALTREEAGYLQERILSSAGGTMLAHLVCSGRGIESSDFPWEYERVAQLPTTVRSELEHARLFSSVMHGAALVYNALVARAAESAEQEADLLDRLSEWVGEMEELRPALVEWDRSAFWQQVSTRNNRVGRPTRVFVDRWVEFAREGAVLASGSVSPDAEQHIATRERALKGVKSRLMNKAALEQWNGEAGTGRLAYRWNKVVAIVRDIQQGLGHA